MLMERPASRRRNVHSLDSHGRPDGFLAETISSGSENVKNDTKNAHFTIYTPSGSQLAAGLVIFLLLAVAFFVTQRATINATGIIAHNANKPHSGPSWPASNFELHPEEHIFRPPTTIELDWVITSADRRPDGVLKHVYLINGLFPGPTIQARSGDKLLVSVRNGLHDEGVAIHWHGLHMQNANHMDGAAGVTQCLIPPGASFVYNFTISSSQSGTFWYHSHSGLQRADGLYGGLVIHRPVQKTIRGIYSKRGEPDILRYNYERELLLLIGDWYHRPAGEVLNWYMRAGSFGNEPVPDSLLINGVGKFDCTMAVPARPVNCSIPYSSSPPLWMDPRKSHRLRVVNTGSLSGFSLDFNKGTLDVIQIDGGIDIQQPTDPAMRKASSAGVLYPGQRMDLIVRLSKQGKPLVTVELDPDCFKYPNPALTPLQTFEIPTSPDLNGFKRLPQLDKPGVQTHIDLARISSASSVLSKLPSKANKTYVVYTKITQMARNQNIPYGYFNHTSWRPQSDPPYPLISLHPQRWDKNQFSISTGNEPVWVDLVVNNLDEGAHPFHLHGHNFYVLSVFESTIGWGSYNPFAPLNNHEPLGPPYDLSKAVLRDTVQIPRRGHAVLRFRADNPGLWLFHCHILWHLASGMAMIIDVLHHSEELDSGIPSSLEACQYVT